LRCKSTYDKGDVYVFEIEKASFGAAKGYDDDEGAVAGEE
jgi:hypothetical protein